MYLFINKIKIDFTMDKIALSYQILINPGVDILFLFTIYVCVHAHMLNLFLRQIKITLGFLKMLTNLSKFLLIFFDIIKKIITQSDYIIKYY